MVRMGYSMLQSRSRARVASVIPTAVPASSRTASTATAFLATAAKARPATLWSAVPAPIVTALIRTADATVSRATVPRRHFSSTPCPSTWLSRLVLYCQRAPLLSSFSRRPPTCTASCACGLAAHTLGSTGPPWVPRRRSSFSCVFRSYAVVACTSKIHTCFKSVSPRLQHAPQGRQLESRLWPQSEVPPAPDRGVPQVPTNYLAVFVAIGDTSYPPLSCILQTTATTPSAIIGCSCFTRPSFYRPCVVKTSAVRVNVFGCLNSVFCIERRIWNGYCYFGGIRTVGAFTFASDPCGISSRITFTYKSGIDTHRHFCNRPSKKWSNVNAAKKNKGCCRDDTTSAAGFCTKTITYGFNSHNDYNDGTSLARTSRCLISLIWPLFGSLTCAAATLLLWQQTYWTGGYPFFWRDTAETAAARQKARIFWPSTTACETCRHLVSNNSHLHKTDAAGVHPATSGSAECVRREITRVARHDAAPRISESFWSVSLQDIGETSGELAEKHTVRGKKERRMLTNCDPATRVTASVARRGVVTPLRVCSRPTCQGCKQSDGSDRAQSQDSKREAPPSAKEASPTSQAGGRAAEQHSPFASAPSEKVHRQNLLKRTVATGMTLRDRAGADSGRPTHTLASSEVPDSAPTCTYGQRLWMKQQPAATAAPQTENFTPQTCLTEVKTEADATSGPVLEGEAGSGIRRREGRVQEVFSRVCEKANKPGVPWIRRRCWTAEDAAAIAALERLPPSESFAAFLWQRFWDEKRRLENHATQSATTAPGSRLEGRTEYFDTAKCNISGKSRASILLAHALTIGPQWAETVLETCPRPAALEHLVGDLVKELCDSPGTTTAADAKVRWIPWLFHPVASLFRRITTGVPSGTAGPPAENCPGEHAAAFAESVEVASQDFAALNALALIMHRCILSRPRLWTRSSLRSCSGLYNSSIGVEATNSRESNGTCVCAGGAALLRSRYAAAADHSRSAALEEGANTGWLRLLTSWWMDVLVQEVRNEGKPLSGELRILQKWIYGDALSATDEAARQNMYTRWPHVLGGASKDRLSTGPALQQEGASGLLQLLALTVVRCLFCGNAAQQLPRKEFRQWISPSASQGSTLQQLPSLQMSQSDSVDKVVLRHLAGVLGKLPFFVQERQHGNRVGRILWTPHAQRLWLECTRVAAAQGSLMSSLTTSHSGLPDAATSERGKYLTVHASNSTNGIPLINNVTEDSAGKQNHSGGLEAGAAVLHGLCLEVQRLVPVWPVAAAACITELLTAAAFAHQHRSHCSNGTEQLQDYMTAESPSQQQPRQHAKPADPCTPPGDTRYCTYSHGSPRDWSSEGFTSRNSCLSSRGHSVNICGVPATCTRNSMQSAKSEMGPDAIAGGAAPSSVYIGKASSKHTLRLPLLPEVFFSLSATLLDTLHPSTADTASPSETRNDGYIWGAYRVPQAVLRLFTNAPAAAGEERTTGSSTINGVTAAILPGLAPQVSMPNKLVELHTVRDVSVSAGGLAAMHPCARTHGEFQGKPSREEGQWLLLVLASLLQGVIHTAGIISSPMHTAVLPAVVETALETAPKSSSSATFSRDDVAAPLRSGSVAAGDSIPATLSSDDCYSEVARAATRSIEPSTAAIKHQNATTGAISTAAAADQHQRSRSPINVNPTTKEPATAMQSFNTKQHIAQKDYTVEISSTSVTANSGLSAGDDNNKPIAAHSNRPAQTGSSRIAVATDTVELVPAGSSRGATPSRGGGSFIKKASDTARGSINFSLSGSLTASDKAAAAAEKATASSITSATLRQASAWALRWLQYGRDLPSTEDQSMAAVTDDEVAGAIETTATAPDIGRMLVRLSLKVAELQQEENVQKHLEDKGRYRLHESNSPSQTGVHKYTGDSMTDSPLRVNSCTRCCSSLLPETFRPLRRAINSWMAAQDYATAGGVDVYKAAEADSCYSGCSLVLLAGVESPHFGMWLEELRFYTLQHMQLQLLADLVERPARLAAAAFFDWDADVSLLETLALLSSSSSTSYSSSAPPTSSTICDNAKQTCLKKPFMNPPEKAVTEEDWVISRWFKGGDVPACGTAFAATTPSPLSSSRVPSQPFSEVLDAPVAALSAVAVSRSEDQTAATVSRITGLNSGIHGRNLVVGRGGEAAFEVPGEIQATSSINRDVAEGLPVARRRADMEAARHASEAVVGKVGRGASKAKPELANTTTIASLIAPANRQETVELVPRTSENKNEENLAGSNATFSNVPASRAAAPSGEAAELVAAVDATAPALDTETTIPVPLFVREAAVKEVLENTERREALQQLALLSCCSSTFPMEQLEDAGGLDVLRLLAKKELDLLLRDPVALALYKKTGERRSDVLFRKQKSSSTSEEELAQTATPKGQTEAALGWLQQVRQFQWIPDVGSIWRGSDKTTAPDQKAQTEGLFLAVENARRQREPIWKEIHQISRIAANVAGAPESPMTCICACLAAWQRLMLQLVHEVYVHPALLSPLFVALREEIPEVTLRLAAPSAVYYEAVRCLHNLTLPKRSKSYICSRSAAKMRQRQRINTLGRPTYLSCIYPFAVPGQPHHLIDPLLLLPPLHSPLSRVFRDFIRSPAAEGMDLMAPGADSLPLLGAAKVGRPTTSNVALTDSSGLSTRPGEADSLDPGVDTAVLRFKHASFPSLLSGKSARPRPFADEEASWTETPAANQGHGFLHRCADERDQSQQQLLPYKPHLPTRHLTKRQLDKLLQALQLHQHRQLQNDVQGISQLREVGQLQKDEHLQKVDLRQSVQFSLGVTPQQNEGNMRPVPLALEPQQNEGKNGREEDIAADMRFMNSCARLTSEDEANAFQQKTETEMRRDADADNCRDKHTAANLGQENAGIDEEKIPGGEANTNYKQTTRAGEGNGNTSRYFAPEQRQSRVRGRSRTDDDVNVCEGPPFIIFLHGLRGSAWRTWRCSHCGNEYVLPDPTASPVADPRNDEGCNNSQSDIIRAEVIGVNARATNKGSGTLQAAYEKAAAGTPSAQPPTCKSAIGASTLHKEDTAASNAFTMVFPSEAASSSSADLSSRPMGSARAVAGDIGAAVAADVVKEKVGELSFRPPSAAETAGNTAAEVSVELGVATPALSTGRQPDFKVARSRDKRSPPCACHVLRDTARQLQLEEKDYTGSTQSFYYLWPRQLLAQQFPHYCILSVDYQAPLFKSPVPFCRRPLASAQTLAALADDKETKLITNDVLRYSEAPPPRSVADTEKETSAVVLHGLQSSYAGTAEKGTCLEGKDILSAGAGTTPSTSAEDSKPAVVHMGLSLHPMRKVSVPPEQHQHVNYMKKSPNNSSDGNNSVRKLSRLYQDSPTGSDTNTSTQRYEWDCDTWVTAGGSAEEEGPTLWQLGRCVQRQLRAAGVGQGDRPIVFVAHSMGGLIAEYLLLHDADIRRNTRAVLFFSTPHLGSPLAEREWLRLVTRSWLPLYVQQLSPVDSTLRKFSSSFARLIHSPAGKHIRIAAIGELRPTPLPYIGRYAMVVPPWSSLPSWLPAQPALLVDVNHSHTCKPASSNDIRYTVLEELLLESLEGEGTQPTARRSSGMGAGAASLELSVH